MLCRVDSQRSCSSKAKYPAPFPRIQRSRQNRPDSEASGCLYRCFAKLHRADSAFDSWARDSRCSSTAHLAWLSCPTARGTLAPILGRDACRPEILLHHRPSTMLKHLDTTLVAIQLLVARRRKFAICPRRQVRLPTCRPKGQG